MNNLEPYNIDKMDGHEFEELIVQLVNKMGFILEERKLSCDGGIDIKAFCDQPLISGKYIIQCKRHQKSIGVPTIRDLYGVINAEHANKGIVITNSTFTQAAINFADNKPIELIDGVKLAKLMDKYLEIKNAHYDTKPIMPETYHISIRLIKDGFNKIIERREKIKQGIIYLKTKNLQKNLTYSEYAQKKSSEFDNLNNVIISQINYFNQIWKRNKEVESYLNIKDLKDHCKELINTFNALEKEWEDSYSTNAGFYQKSQDILCAIYDYRFQEYEKFINYFSEIIDNPEKFSDQNKHIAFEFDAGGDDFQNLCKKYYKSFESSCFIATAIYQDPFSAEVLFLKRWRDQVLVKSCIGCFFIRIYKIFGPKLAFIVIKIPLIRNLIKTIFDVSMKYMIN